MDLDWGMSAGALISDNVFRVQPGLEVKGQIYSYRLEFDLEESTETSTYLLSGFGGWERTISDTDDTRDLIYGLGVDLNWDLKRDYYIRLNAGGSRETGTLDPVNLNRTRALTDRVDAEFALGRESASQVSWEASVSADRVQRELEDSRIARVSALLTIPLSQRTDLHSEASGFMGEERIIGDEWTGGNVNIGVSTSSSRRTVRGGDLFWASSRTEFAGTSATTWWQNVGMSARQDGRISPRTSYRAELGAESLNIKDGDREYEPLAELVLDSRLGRETTLSIFAAQRIAVSLNDRRQPVWSRRSSGGANIQWLTWRTVTLFADFTAIRDDFPEGQATPGRIDDETLGRIGIRWNPSDVIGTELAAAHDQVDSTLPQWELVENRLELTVTGRF